MNQAPNARIVPRITALAAALVVALASIAGIPGPGLRTDARAQAPPAGGTPPSPPPSRPGTPTGAPAVPSARGERMDGVAATVNDEVILQSEVDEQVYLFLVQNNLRPDSAGVAQLRREVIDRLIDEKVIVSEAKRQNISVSDAEVEKNVNEAIADARKRVGSDAAFQEELRREGLTEADLKNRYRDDVRRQLLANQLLRSRLEKGGEVTPAEAEKYFNEHPNEFPKRPSAIHVQIILIPVEADSAAWVAARKEANEALARVKKGEPFSRLAQELSDDTGTAKNGGDLGWFKRGTLDSTFEEAAFKLPVGQVSNPVRTPFGFHLIKVEEADAAKGEIHARHILFGVTPTRADQDRSLKQIEEVRAQAAKGVHFGTLARRYSKYKGPAGPDGDLGFVPMTVFSSDFRAALDTTEVGQLSPILLNPQGFHLFKVLDREAERPYKADEVKEQLPEMVRRARMQSQYETFVADLRKKAQIEYR
ncbi:MAG: peptidylprolyl isomerase [Candidatus Eiseniibacteriota bacterium]